MICAWYPVPGTHFGRNMLCRTGVLRDADTLLHIRRFVAGIAQTVYRPGLLAGQS